MSWKSVYASGTIGGAVAEALRACHDVVGASRSGDIAVDIRDSESIEHMFQRVGPVDAVVSTAAGVPYVAVTDATPADILQGFGDRVTPCGDSGSRWVARRSP